MLAFSAVACFAVLVLFVYGIRHLLFTASRLFEEPQTNYADLAGFHIPSVSILIPMHNEAAVARDLLNALAAADYPHEMDRFEVIPIDDHSDDDTGKILEAYAARYDWIKPIYRRAGKRGKPAALEVATRVAKGEILVLFDADYVPGKSFLKFIAAPFSNPEVGAVMGRVVPHNVEASLLTRLLDLERAGGYQVNQQARFSLGLITQFGGTAGAVRRSALESVGRWNSESLTEDTDLTLRLAINGWSIVYLNRAECYEEVPVSWEVRRRQIERWAIGHTECFHVYVGKLLRSPHLNWSAKLDGILLLGIYLTAPVLVMGWVACFWLFLSGYTVLPTIAGLVLATAVYNGLGNFVSVIELGTSTLLDGSRERIRLLPLNIANFFFSTAAVTSALIKYYSRSFRGSSFTWTKTQRYRGNQSLPTDNDTGKVPEAVAGGMYPGSGRLGLSNIAGSRSAIPDRSAK